MSEVRRWEHTIVWEGLQISATYMAINDGGEYVMHDDYDALHAEVEALRAENARLKRTVEEGMPRLMQQGYELRTQLEAARGLLRESREAYTEAIHWEDQRPVMKKIDDFLAAHRQAQRQ